MATPSRMAALAIAASFITAAYAQGPGAAATQTSALKIVVLKGEDAVNIIQQKTAVAPLVEVRDRNNLPVPGAIVTFTVGGGQGATFGGATTLTVTTNAAGQAAAAGFTPTVAGAVQVNATAVFQGQTAIATITQTNVMTAAEAAGAAGGGGAGSGGAGGGGAGGGGTSGAAGGAAGGAGGGLGAGAIAGIVGGVAAGGAVAVKAAGGSDSSSTSGTGGGTAGTNPTTTAPTTTTTAPTTTTTTAAPSQSGTFSGPADGPYVATFSETGQGLNISCTFNYAYTGTTMRMTLTTSPSGTLTGNVDYAGTISNVSNTCNQPGIAPPALGVLQTGPFTQSAALTGTPSSFRFTQDLDQSQQGFTIRTTVTISGSLNNGVVTGTYVTNFTMNGTSSGITLDMKGTINIPFTLR